jgi:AcrR family transcriptional regulator
MEIVDSIESGFRTLLTNTVYDKITVDQICKVASVSKKTFYKHFESKHDLLIVLIHNDIIAPVLRLRAILPLDEIKSSPLLVTERTYQTLYENRAVYRNILASLGRTGLADLILTETYTFNCEVFGLMKMTPEETEYASYFVAASDAMIQARWLEQGCPTPPKQMAKLCGAWVMSHFRESSLHAWD